MIEIQSAVLSHPGKKRLKNEDYITFFVPADATLLSTSGSIFILADGVGGATRGDKASQFAAQKILHDYYQYPNIPIPERLSQVIRSAGNEIYDFAENQGEGMRMATTVVVAVIQNNLLRIAHVGDSRAYLISDSKVMQLTLDHSKSGDMVRKGLLTEAEALQYKGRNPISRSLGGQRDVQVDISDEITVKPGDSLLLASDGLTNYLTKQNISNFIKQGQPDEVVYKLVDYANQCGGSDNISVILIEAIEKDVKRSKYAQSKEPHQHEFDSAPTLYNHIPRDQQNKKHISEKLIWRSHAIKIILIIGLIIVAVLLITHLPAVSNYLSKIRFSNNNQQFPPATESVEQDDQENHDHENNLQNETIDQFFVVTDSDDINRDNYEEITSTLIVETKEVDEVIEQVEERGQCTYTIHFDDFGEEHCHEGNMAVGDCLDTRPDRASVDKWDIFCVIQCKFPEKFSEFPEQDPEPSLEEYALTIKAEGSLLNNRMIYNGLTLQLPNISNVDCITAGGAFELNSE